MPGFVRFYFQVWLFRLMIEPRLPSRPFAELAYSAVSAFAFFVYLLSELVYARYGGQTIAICLSIVVDSKHGKRHVVGCMEFASEKLLVCIRV